MKWLRISSIEILKEEGETAVIRAEVGVGVGAEIGIETEIEIGTGIETGETGETGATGGKETETEVINPGGVIFTLFL